MEFNEIYIDVDYFYYSGSRTASLSIINDPGKSCRSLNIMLLPNAAYKNEILVEALEIIKSSYPELVTGMCEAVHQAIENYFCRSLMVDACSFDYKEFRRRILPEFSYRYAMMFDEVAELGEPDGFWFPQDKEIRVSFLNFLIDITK